MGAQPVGQLDKQLEDLLARLRAAGGDPVSFEELRAQGFENPALLAYELEVAGVPIGRVTREGGIDSPPVAIQLEHDHAEDTQPMAPVELPDHPLQRLRSGVEWVTLLLADTREEAAELSARAAAAVRGRAAAAGAAGEAARLANAGTDETRELGVGTAAPRIRSVAGGVTGRPADAAPRTRRTAGRRTGSPGGEVAPRTRRTAGRRTGRPALAGPPATDSGLQASLRRDPKRAAALAALALVCLVVLGVVLANLGGASSNRRTAGPSAAARTRAQAFRRGAAPSQPTAGTPAGTPAPATTPSQTVSATPPPVTTSGQTQPPAQSATPPPSGAAAGAAPSPQTAAGLESQGHQLLAEGNYEQAISQLRAAVTASGQSVAGCAEPSSEACLTYAYALYDLGRALRLDGQTASALAVLGERLQIDNQRPVVESEIALARGADGGPAGGPAGAPEAPVAPKDAAPLRHAGRRRAHEGRRRRGQGWRLRRPGGVGASRD